MYLKQNTAEILYPLTLATIFALSTKFLLLRIINSGLVLGREKGGRRCVTDVPQYLLSLTAATVTSNYFFMLC